MPKPAQDPPHPAAPGRNQDLTTGSIPALIRRVAVPASMGMFFNSMFNITDTWFAGRISTEAVAALSASFPVFFLIMSVGSGLHVGASALMGEALGKGDRARARTLAAQAFTFGLLMSIVLTACGIPLLPHLFRLLGAQGQYLSLSLQYMTPIFAGAFTIMTVYMANAGLVATGDTGSQRNVLGVAAVVNVALDPWFIHGGFGLPAFGLAGVAYATLLVQGGGALYLILRSTRADMLDFSSPSAFIPRPRLLAEIARQGFPAAMNYLTIGLGIFVIMWFVGHYGPDAVAAYGIAVRVEQMALLPTIGLNVATLSIVSQNYGACDFGRIHTVIGKSLKYGAVMMLPAGVVVWTLAPWFMGLFSADPQVLETGISYLRIDALVLYAYVILFVNTAALQGVQRPMFAVWIGLFRQIAAPAAVFWLLARTLGMGVTGIWWGIFAVTWFSAAIAAVYAGRAIRGMERSYAKGIAGTGPHWNGPPDGERDSCEPE